MRWFTFSFFLKSVLQAEDAQFICVAVFIPWLWEESKCTARRSVNSSFPENVSGAMLVPSDCIAARKHL